MCKAFSCIVEKDGEVYWKAGLDSHDDIAEHFKLKDNIAHRDLKDFARVEITPDKGYLYPRGHWSFILDESMSPRWWKPTYEVKARKALADWRKEVYALFNLKEARHPVNPLKGNPVQPTDADIELLKQWDSVRDSVRDSVWDSVRDSVWTSVGDSVWNSVWNSVRDSVVDSVGDSVWNSVRDSVWNSVRDSVVDSVGDSVWAYIGSLFNPPQWREKYPCQPVVDLWKRGLIPSFDGKIWRLHSGAKAEIVYSTEVKQ